jgi:hypothetical protein
MSPEPYAAKSLNTAFPCAAKEPVTGKLCCILHARAEKRGLELAQFPSRAIPKHEIHELILTLEGNAGPGQIVDCIAYLGYFEVENGGVIWTGDKVMVNGRCVGTLAGYDLTHFPNHMNIVVKAEGPLLTGEEAGFQPGDPISFIFPGRPQREGKV